MNGRGVVSVRVTVTSVPNFRSKFPRILRWRTPIARWDLIRVKGIKKKKKKIPDEREKRRLIVRDIIMQTEGYDV